MHNGDKEEHIWKPDTLLGCLLVFSCFVVTMSGHRKRLWPKIGMITNGSDTSRVIVWVTSPGKSPRPAKVRGCENG